MAMKSALCGLSLRMGTLLLLYCFLVVSVWGLLTQLTNYGDPMFKHFLNDHAAMLYTGTFFMIVGGLIFLATIISITNDTPSLSLLSTTIAFVILRGIFSIYATIQYTSDGIFRDLFNTLVEKQIRELPKEEQYMTRSFLLDNYQVVLRIVYVMMAGVFIFKMYSILVFYGYYAQLKQNLYDTARRNASDKEALLSEPLTCEGQFVVPQYLTKPPQYTTQASHQYFVNTKK